MVELISSQGSHTELSTDELLYPGEIIVIVDDAPEICLLLSSFVQRLNIPNKQAGTAKKLYHLLETENVALILLDIGLPDEDGTDVLKNIVPSYPDLGIIMVTGTTDIKVALNCLRDGADDYLTKPVTHQQFILTLEQTLKKRRLAIENRRFQQELESKNFRTQFLHHLNLKMNTAYLNTVKLQGVLQAILVGITSEEGLRFNRAFLALWDDDQNILHGTLAIGPAKREDATKVWHNIKSNNLGLQSIVEGIIDGKVALDKEVNKLIQTLNIPSTDLNHILIHACQERKSILVNNESINGFETSINQLMQLLDHDTFVITPLFSPGKSLGVIIADNFVTVKDITDEDISSLEIFANQASLAIEHSKLYREMTGKINELEQVRHEIEKNKDMLVEAERFSTLGHMSAQLVHAIRNPVTALGGTARLLNKKNSDPSTAKFLQIIIKEASRIESTLEDLFHYVEDGEPELEYCPINKLLKKSVMVFYTQLQKKRISTSLDFATSDPYVSIDPKKFRQALHHLIKNSIEAMQTGGTLSISSQLQNKDIIIEISDTGDGIEDNSLKNVRDAFYTTKTYGTGMGLTLVEHIIRIHGGTFTLTNNTTTGMSATIKLPSPNHSSSSPE